MALFAEPRMRAPRLAAGLNRLDVNLRLAGKFRVRALVTAGPRNASSSMVVPSREEPGDLLGAGSWPKAGLSWTMSGPVQTRAGHWGCAICPFSALPSPLMRDPGAPESPSLPYPLTPAGFQVPGVQTLFFPAFLPS